MTGARDHATSSSTPSMRSAPSLVTRTACATFAFGDCERPVETLPSRKHTEVATANRLKSKLILSISEY